MKKTKNIMIALLIISVMILAGCNTTPNATGKIIQNNQELKTIKIGVIFPMSGPGSPIADSARKAISLAQKENPNTKYNYEVIYEDDEATPTKTISAFYKLVTIDNVDAIISASGGPGHAIAPLAEEQEIPMFSITSDIEVVRNRKYAFRHWVTAENQAEAYVDEAIKRGYKSVGIIIAYQQGFDSIEKALIKEAKNKLEIKITEKVDPKTKDFRTEISKIKSKNPYAYLIILNPEQILLAVKQIEEIDSKAEITSIESFGYVEDKDNLLEGQWYIDSDPTNEFIYKFETEYGSGPLIASGNSYDSYNLLVEAFENGNGDREQATEYLYTINDFDGALGKLSIDEDGSVQSDATVKEKVNGQWVKI